MASNETSHQRTLWLGNVLAHWDESFLFSLFASTGEVTQVRLMRGSASNNANANASRYAFIEFRTHAVAKQVLDTWNGHAIPGTTATFRLNWGLKRPQSINGSNNNGSDEKNGDNAKANVHDIYVGDLDGTVADTQLEEFFKAKYSSVVEANVVTDVATGLSRGYGFVRFSDQEESQRALSEMQGAIIGDRAIRVGEGNRRSHNGQGSAVSNGGKNNITNGSIDATINSAQSQAQLLQQRPSAVPIHRHSNTVFVGGIGDSIDVAAIKTHFSQCGNIENVKIPAKKGCAFVTFSTYEEAFHAIHTLQNSQIGKYRLRLDWGKFSSKTNSGGGHGYAAAPQQHHQQQHILSVPNMMPPGAMLSPNVGAIGIPGQVTMYRAAWVPVMGSAHHPGQVSGMHSSHPHPHPPPPPHGMYHYHHPHQQFYGQPAAYFSTGANPATVMLHGPPAYGAAIPIHQAADSINTASSGNISNGNNNNGHTRGTGKRQDRRSNKENHARNKVIVCQSPSPTAPATALPALPTSTIRTTSASSASASFSESDHEDKEMEVEETMEAQKNPAKRSKDLEQIAIKSQNVG